MQEQETDCVTTVEWFINFVMVYWRGHKGITLSGNDVEKAKRKHVALSKVKMDCRHIFEQCRLSPKPLGRPQGYEDCTIDVNKTILLYFLLRQVFYCPQNDR